MLRATPVPLILIETIIKPLTLKYSIKFEDVLDFGDNFIKSAVHLSNTILSFSRG